MPPTKKAAAEVARPAQQGTQAEQEYAMLMEKLAEAAAVVEGWTAYLRSDADDEVSK